ncbi:unnamed protein product [Didymodactylos carnosus]|uniref:Uncharacterized protein n=1 Tax=Didymodactylos carnosus TaxID=1234261 RepID=A0A8S2E1G0_9BILA|nr:unnamed protein product [Didymodactylos carnosus]CAF3821740.1 unnamed protein product [Didymodactylos carnosus]
MAHLQLNAFELEDITKTATVPDNDIAKIMYYLSCVCSSINYNENNIQRYTNYAQYYVLSNDEKLEVIALCAKLSPDVFIDKCWFQSDALCGNMSNKFYNFKQLRQDIVAVESIVIADTQVHVKEIMVYTQSWMMKHYYLPMRRLVQAPQSQPQIQWQYHSPIQRQYQPQVQQQPRPAINYSSTIPTHTPQRSGKVCSQIF